MVLQVFRFSLVFVSSELSASHNPLLVEGLASTLLQLLHQPLLLHHALVGPRDGFFPLNLTNQCLQTFLLQLSHLLTLTELKS